MKTAWVLGSILVAFLLLVFCVLVFANTDPGRSAIASLLNPLLGGSVSVAGLSGRFPDAPTAEHVEISDDRGVWLKLDRLSANWSPLQLLRNRISAHSLTAESATVLRWPVPGKSESGNSPPMDFKRVSIGRLTIGKAIAGRPIVLSVYGVVYYTSGSEFSGVIHARRLDGQGDYQAHGRLKDSDLTGTASFREPGNGLIADILGFPDLGPLAVVASAAGPRTNNRIGASVTAGPLRASAQGMLDLLHHTAALAFEAASPAARLRDDFTWQTLALKGEVHGAFAEPDIVAYALVQGLHADGGSVQSLSASAQGRHGDIRLNGTVSALRLPGAHPDVFRSSPLAFGAHARFDTPKRTIDIAVRHTLLDAAGHVAIGPEVTQGAFTVNMPSLASFSSLGGIDIHGSAHLNAIVSVQAPRSTFAFNGTARLTGGSPAVMRLAGRDARFAGLVTAQDRNVTIDQVTLDGVGASASAAGFWRPGALNVGWNFALKDLSLVAGTLKGHLGLAGNLSGSGSKFAVVAEGTGVVATKGFASGPLSITARAQGLPLAPAGTVAVSGRLDGAPLALSAKLTQATKGAWQLGLEKADWKSVHAQGALIAARSSTPTGKFELHVGRLADLAPVIGQSLGGTVDGTIVFASAGGRERAHALAQSERLVYDDARVGTLKLEGDISDPLTKPAANIAYTATDIAAGNVHADLRGTARGSANALALTFDSDLHLANVQTAQIAGELTADVPKRQFTLEKYDVHSAGQFAHLAAKARFDLSNGVAVDKLRILADRAEFEIAGRLAPRLAATLAIHNVTADLVRPFLPGALARGTFSATAALSGSLTAPEGTVSVNGNGLRPEMEGSGAAPPADLVATATLHGTAASVHANIHSGSRVQLTIAGYVPLRPAGSLNLHAIGDGDLAILDPVLNVEGRSLHGMLALDATATGPVSKPRVTGSAQLSNGEFQDYVRGIHISAISASLHAHGDAIAIDNFSAHAGDGTITGRGSIDLTAPGEPLNLSVVAKNAKPISNDVLNATLDADLRLSGRLAQQFALSGNVFVRQGEVDIPDSLPSSVAVLALRGRSVRLPPPPPVPLSLDLTVRSSGQLYVRGHGVDAEMSGRAHVGGTTLAPDVSGGFDLRRGNLSLAGQSLNFTSGRVSFDGSSLRERIDPALDFAAQTTAGGITATLSVTGHASAPKIALSSAPPLPQDEVLAHLLFQQSTTQLSPWQMAQLGQALASLSGMGGLGDPLTRVRKSLGLDRLAVTTAGATGTETAVEAGRYVAHNVYVGAKQDVSGSGGTQAIVQVDLTKHLKLQTQISSNNTPTPVTPGTTPVDTGSNLGLSYQFEY